MVYEEMASIRKTRTMPTDAAIAKFLYTILKQLDIKPVNWNEVASSLGITNGHAARMRFARFKQQMEGIQPKPQIRNPRVRVRPNQASGNGAVCLRDEVRTHESKKGKCIQARVKKDPDVLYDSTVGAEVTVPSLQGIKTEPKEDPMPDVVPVFVLSPVSEDINAAKSQLVSGQGSQIVRLCSEQRDSGSILGTYGLLEPSSIVKHESTVKVESGWS